MNRVQVVGIINRTPDSFHDQGATFSFDDAIRAAADAERAGADWVDVGGCPIGRAHEVSEAEEISRVVPVIAYLIGRRVLTVPVMVDTFRSAVAREAIAAGAQGVNDTSGLYDPCMASVAADAGVLLVLTHSRCWPDPTLSRPPYEDVVAEVRDELLRLMRRAVEAGVPVRQLVLDPGHGLWKSTAESLELTRRLGEITGVLPYPVMVAASAKEFVADTVGPDQLVAGTVAVNVAAILSGASWIRVHDVAAGVAAARMGAAILGEPAGASSDEDAA